MDHQRHRVVFTLLRPLIQIWLKARIGSQAIPAPDLPNGSPALIYVNHNMNLDPLVVACSFRRPIVFVASDHVFRLGLVSRLINFLVAPIPIVKARIDLQTIRAMREQIQAGRLVCIFPEGNRSFHGRTFPITDAAAKLARQMNCPLILCRLEGSYLTSPRWSDKMRRGQVVCRVTRVVSAETLNQLTPAEAGALIWQELNIDAYAVQREQMIPFRGRNLAQNIELSLFFCPRCGTVESMRGSGDRVQCPCGLDWSLDVYGFFHPHDSWSRAQAQAGQLPDDVARLADRQLGVLRQYLQRERTPDEPIFADDQQRLVRTERASRSAKLADGRLALFADRLTFHADDGRTLLDVTFAEIRGLIVHGRMTLQLALQDGSVYEVRSLKLRSGWKYTLAYDLLNQNA